jgi:hypothetical protein
MNRWLFLPNDVIRDLRVLSNLSVENLKILSKIVGSSNRKRGYKLYLHIAGILSITDECAASLYSFCNYVQNERSANKKSSEDVIREIEFFLKTRGSGREADKDDTNTEVLRRLLTKKESLLELFGEFPSRSRSQKIRSLAGGPLPHLHSLRTFCDVRPVYNSDGNSIENLITIITLNMVTHSSVSNKKSEIFVHLSNEDVRRMRKELIRVTKKLKTLINKFPEVQQHNKKDGIDR